MLSFIFNAMLVPYSYLCKALPFELPMKKYLVERFMKNNFKNRTHIIFDQLNQSMLNFTKKRKYVNLLKKMVSLLSKLTIVLEIIGLLEQLKNNFKFLFFNFYQYKA